MCRYKLGLVQLCAQLCAEVCAATHTLDLQVRILDGTASIIVCVTTIVAHMMSLQAGESQDRVMLVNPLDGDTLRLYQDIAIFMPGQSDRLVPINDGAKQRESLLHSQRLLGIARVLKPGRN